MIVDAASGPEPRRPVSDRTRIRIGRVAMAGSVLVGVLGPTFVVVVGGWTSAYLGVLLMAVSAVGFGALCWVLIGAQPRNGAVWALAWAAFFAALALIGNGFEAWEVRNRSGITEIDLLTPADVSLGAAFGLWLESWPGFLPFFLPLTLGLLLFPDGRLPSPNWRWAAWASIAAMATMAVPVMWVNNPASVYTYGHGESSTQPEVVGLLVGIGYLSGVVCSIFGVVALLVRYRRTDAETKQQIRLAVVGFVLFLSLTAASAIVDALSGGGLNSDDIALLDRLFLLTGQIVVIAAFATAILRFRLYDIDIVISKALMSLALAAFITSLYIALVVGVGGLVGGRSSFLLSIVATTVIALLFQPVRRIVQRAADRVIYGNRASPYESLARFGRRAAELPDDELLARVPRLLVDGTSADRATLWLKSAEGFVEGASWPASQRIRRSISTGTDASEGCEVGGFVDPEADRSFPIIHEGEVLGGISVVAGRGERMTVSDDNVLTNLGSALGLTMRNTRLTSRLQDRVADLEASRERLMAAADSARRSVEKQLDRGPLQQLAGLASGLEEAQEEARPDGSEELAGTLARLTTDAVNARAVVMDFARGVYPPRLEADGLVAAIAEQVESAVLPITVRDGTVGRYSRAIESAVYFTVLEALQNTTKHAKAELAQVTLSEREGVLTFQVIDDGSGFDPAAVTQGTGLLSLNDRMDTVGGTVELESTPGVGTTIRGSVLTSTPTTTGASDAD